MAITYSGNIITVTGYTEASPCTFTDIYNADKAGTLSLHARTGITAADTDPVAVDRAERPTDYVVLGGTSNDLYITVANWNGTTATIRITGTDRDGAAQTEDIVVTANGDYYTTKWFKTITQTQVTAFTGTSFDYDLTQGQWGVVWNQGTDQYTFDAKIYIGDGSIVTWFQDTEKQITSSISNAISIRSNATAIFGCLADLTNKLGKQGCVFNLPAGGYIECQDNDTAKTYYYDCVVNGAIKTRAERIWQTSVSFLDTLQKGDVYQSIIRDATTLILKPQPVVTINDCVVYEGTGGIKVANDGKTYKVSNVKIYNVTYTVDTYAFGFSSASTLNCVNVESDWTFHWYYSPKGIVYRQYEFDLKVIDKDNTPINAATVKIWDKDSTLIVDTTTDANGVIATQTISRGYYNQANGNTLQEYSPHLIKIEKVGYTTYEADFTLEEKTDWTIALQGVLKRNPAMTGGMV